MFAILIDTIISNTPNFYAGHKGMQGTLQFATDVKFAKTYKTRKAAEKKVISLLVSKEDRHHNPKVVCISPESMDYNNDIGEDYRMMGEW